MTRSDSPAPRRLPHVSTTQLRWLRRTLQVLQFLSSRLAARFAFRLFLTPNRRRLDAADAPSLQQAKLHWLECGGGQVRVYEWGTGPRTALILHGWGSHAPRFSPLALALVNSGWRVLTPDAPGHGESAGQTSSLPQFMAALDVVVARLGPVHAVVGHSLGALAIALWLSGPQAAQATDLRKAVLISMPSGAPFLIESFHQMFGIGARTRERMAALFRGRFRADPARYVLAEDARISVPLLLVHDRHDDVVPVVHSQQIHDRYPNGQFHVTEGLGHSGLLRNAETIQRIKDFLGSN